MDTTLIIILIVAILILIGMFLLFVPVGLLIAAMASGATDVTPVCLIAMRLRGVPQKLVVLPLIVAIKSGVAVSLAQLEAHYLAGGNVDRVVMALAAAHRAQIPLTFEQAAAIDLSGRDVLGEIRTSIISNGTL